MNQRDWDSGFYSGYIACEAKVREALRGHPQSELWGEHGLLAATMRSNDGYRERIEKAAQILRESISLSLRVSYPARTTNDHGKHRDHRKQ